MLTYLNNRFINLSLKNKIELYLLPLMILYLVYYISSNFFVLEKPIEIKNKINFKEYENKKFQGSFLELFSNIEKAGLEHNIEIVSLNNKNNIVSLKIKAQNKELPIFIKEIENINNFTKIDSISMYDGKDYDTSIFDLKIDLNKFYIKKFEKIKKDNYEKLIDTKEIENTKNIIPNNSYELKAIIADYVLLNDMCLKIGEKIDDFILKEIKKNSIVLENEKNKIELELRNEEYIKSIY